MAQFESNTHGIASSTFWKLLQNLILWKNSFLFGVLGYFEYGYQRSFGHSFAFARKSDVSTNIYLRFRDLRSSFVTYISTAKPLNAHKIQNQTYTNHDDQPRRAMTMPRPNHTTKVDATASIASFRPIQPLYICAGVVNIFAAENNYHHHQPPRWHHHYDYTQNSTTKHFTSRPWNCSEIFGIPLLHSHRNNVSKRHQSIRRFESTR